jgi:sporulation protein YunB
MARWFSLKYRLWPKYRLPRRYHHWKFPKKIVLTVTLIIILLFSFSVVESNLSPAILTMAEARAHLIATETIHRILYEKVLANISYNDLVFVHKDNQQRITMMQANTIKISQIISQANLEIKDKLRTLNEDAVYVPVGQVLGSKILANFGPKIKVEIIPVGTANVQFHDEFQQAGINQSRHILYLNIHAVVSIVIPTASRSVAIDNQVPIAETIIVGEVPSTYFGVEAGLVEGLLKNQ